MLPAGRSEITYRATAEVPDATEEIDADAPEIAENELVGPFVEAATETGDWPKNENTAAMQIAVGQALSDVISGGSSPSEAASGLIENVDAELEGGVQDGGAGAGQVWGHGVHLGS